MYVENKTQEQKILHLLESANGGWVPLIDILRLGIAQYNARIYGLRKKGHIIQNKKEPLKGNKKYTYFKLIKKEDE